MCVLSPPPRFSLTHRRGESMRLLSGTDRWMLLTLTWLSTSSPAVVGEACRGSLVSILILGIHFMCYTCITLLYCTYHPDFESIHFEADVSEDDEYVRHCCG